MPSWLDLFQKANVNRAISGVLAVAGSSSPDPHTTNDTIQSETNDSQTISIQTESAHSLSSESLASCALAGIAECQYLRGLALEHGDGVSQDIPSAKRLYELAYQKGYDKAGVALLRLLKSEALENEDLPAAISTSTHPVSRSLDLNEGETVERPLLLSGGKLAQPHASAGAPKEIVVLPKAVSTPPPKYPTASIATRAKGRVVLILDIDEHGLVTGVGIEVSSRNRDIDTAAIEAAKKWLFKPGTVNGVTLPSRIRMPVDFDL